MDSYILRIYRSEHDKAEGIVGMLHEVASDVGRPFHGLDELCEMLCLSGTICRRKKKRKVTGCRRGKGSREE